VGRPVDGPNGHRGLIRRPKCRPDGGEWRARTPTLGTLRRMDAGSGEREIERLRNGYLEVVKRALTHTLYRPMDVRFNDSGYVPDESFRETVTAELTSKDFDWVQVRADGRDWPRFAQTMVGLRRLENVEQCVKQVIIDKVPGDLIEAGVWRGGVAIFMRAILEAYNESDRIVYAADSFEGLPPPDETAFPADAGSRLHTADVLAVSRHEVARNFDLYGLLDDQVRFLEGWFRDTLPTVRDRTWAVVRLDGDMYESTMDALTNLYPGLAVGGYLIVDDYEYEPCKKAVEEYRAANGITDPVVPIDWLGAFWRRTK
jgi:O-methyltransferase